MTGRLFTISNIWLFNGVVYSIAEKITTTYSDLSDHQDQTIKSGYAKYDMDRIEDLCRLAQAFGLIVINEKMPRKQADRKDYQATITEIGLSFYRARAPEKWTFSLDQIMILRDVLESSPDTIPELFPIKALQNLLNRGIKGKELGDQFRSIMGKENEWKTERTKRDYLKFTTNYLADLHFITDTHHFLSTSGGKAIRKTKGELTCPPPSFLKDEIYIRSEIHDMYGGNRQRGISSSRDFNLIFLFSGPSGEEHGYRDGWSVDGSYHYTGEGQKGDMEWTFGNKAIQEHFDNHKDLHLFEQFNSGKFKYIGQMIYAGYEELNEDFKGTPRKVIVFHLLPVESITNSIIGEPKVQPNQPTIDELKERAKGDSTSVVSVREALVKIRERSENIREYALIRAKGRCEFCLKDAPFLSSNGRPFLEVHQILRLSDGGPDDIEFVIALCPNCHRRAHYSRDSNTINKEMLSIIEGIENRNKGAD